MERQEADCRALAERLGWDVVAVYVDNDVSAHSGRTRPEYRRMLRDVQAGRVRSVVAWHTDRLHRRATELEEFVAVAEAHQLQVQTVTAGTVDLTTPSGRMVARMLGAAAQHEVDHARERMQRAKAQMAADGKYRGGPRPFGYNKDGQTIRQSEADLIRKAAKELLAGRTLASVAKEMNAAGSRTTMGREWNHGNLKGMMVRPRNAGLLSQGRSERPAEMRVIGPATWPPILEEETWRALYDLLTAPTRRHERQTTEPKWLGSGLYLCGLCGSTLRTVPYGGTNSRRRQVRQYHYRCVASAHLTIHQRRTDEYVMATVVEMLRDPRVVAALNTQEAEDTLGADRERRSVLLRRLEQFEADYAAGAITGPQLAKATATVETQLTEVDERLTEGVRRTASLPVVAATDPGQAFLDSPLDVQRAVLRALLRVEILPNPRRGGAWSADRLSLTRPDGVAS